LADNGPRAVSQRNGRLRKIRMLVLGPNQLTKVPEAIGELEQERERGRQMEGE